jgi:uncharacterized membrane protein
MPFWFRPVTEKTPTRLEAQEMRVSLVVCLLAVGLMLGGFAALMAQGLAWVVPGYPAPHLSALFSRQPLGWTAMSLGIILLGVLPLLRVGLAVKSYADARAWRDFLIALVVLAELLLSMSWGA